MSEWKRIIEHAKTHKEQFNGRRRRRRIRRRRRRRRRREIQP